MEKKIEDKDLGMITIRRNPRATRYIIKIKDGAVIGILPMRGDELFLMQFIEQNRQKLKRQLAGHPRTLLDETTTLQTFSFSVHIFRTDRTGFQLTLKDGILHMACPQTTTFEDPAVQRTLNGMLESALRHEAKRLLPARLAALAAQYSFSFSGVRIQNSKGRWGSCSTRGSINLSLSLMLLPGHLIDYVLLHELCHTVEMNHGERFWALMNRVTDNRARQLREELRKYKPR